MTDNKQICVLKLPKRLLNLAYQIILDEVWRIENLEDRPTGYKEDLCELIAVLEKEVLKQRDF